MLPVIQHQLEQVWLGECGFSDNDVILLLSAVLPSARMKFCDCSAHGVHPALQGGSIAALRASRPDLEVLV
jgi:hypothetical protein